MIKEEKAQEKKYFVYKHTFPNGKVYIGITKQKPEKRWNRGFGYISQKPIWDAILEFGWENIKHDVLYENLSEDEARAIEHDLIKEYKSTYGKKGYNSTTGGYESKIVYDISFERPVIQLNSNVETIGAYDRLIDAAKDLKVSPVKILVACINRNNFKGSTITFKHHFVKGFMWEYDERICKYSIDGELIAEYSSYSEAYSENKIKGIQRCCNGRPDFPTAGGFVWRYAAHPFDKYSIEIPKKV